MEINNKTEKTLEFIGDYLVLNSNEEDFLLSAGEYKRVKTGIFIKIPSGFKLGIEHPNFNNNLQNILILGCNTTSHESEQEILISLLNPSPAVISLETEDEENRIPGPSLWNLGDSIAIKKGEPIGLAYLIPIVSFKK